MKTEEAIAFGVLGVGGLYLLSRSGGLAGIAADANAAVAAAVPGIPGLPTNPNLTPGQQLALDTIATQEQAAPGNAPAVPGASFIGTPQGLAAVDTAVIGAAGLIDGAIFTSAVVAGVATLGIGLVVAFFSYEYFAQQASIAANRWRDAWQKQFIALSDALGIPHITVGTGASPGTDGTSNGNIEMSRVIFYFDHDSTGRLWTAVTKTQNLAAIQVAAKAIDTFLKGQGIPVQGP